MHVVHWSISRLKTISEGAKVKNVIASGSAPCRPDNGFRDIEISCFKEIQPPTSQTTAVYRVLSAIPSSTKRHRRLFLTYSHIQYRLDLWPMAYRGVRAVAGGGFGIYPGIRSFDMVFVDVFQLRWKFL